MAFRTTSNLGSSTQKRNGTVVTLSNSISYALIGLCFAALLIISASNDYLFFEWLSLGAFMVFALIGMHFIGQKQIKRN